MNERFVSPVPQPTPYENELLTILIEECSEVQQRITKSQRFGINEIQPGQPLTNSTRLAHEIGDLLEVVDRCMNAGLLRPEDVEDGRANKRKQLAKFMQHAPPG